MRQRDRRASTSLEIGSTGIQSLLASNIPLLPNSQLTTSLDQAPGLYDPFSLPDAAGTFVDYLPTPEQKSVSGNFWGNVQDPLLPFPPGSSQLLDDHAGLQYDWEPKAVSAVRTFL